MHSLLANIFEEHPGEKVFLSLGKFPRIAVNGDNWEVTKGLDAPLTPEKMAEIINSLLTEDEAAWLKRYRVVDKEVADEVYLRRIEIECQSHNVIISVTSRLLRDIEAENKIAKDAAVTFSLIKG